VTGPSPSGSAAAAVAWDQLVALAILCAFGAALVAQTGLSPADEWMYAAMARMVGEGAAPYRDFFFSHPPLQLVPVVHLEFALPATVPASKLVPIGASVLTAVLLFFTARHWSRAAGLAALLLWVTSDTVLAGGAQFTGLCEGILLLAIAIAAASRGRGRAPGIAVALCVATSTLVGAVAIAWLVGLCLFGGRRWWRSAAWFVAFLAGFWLLCALVFGWQFFDQVYFSPLARPSEFATTSRWSRVFAPQLLRHLAWLPAMGLGLCAAFWHRLPLPESARSQVPQLACAVAAALAILGLFDSVHGYYMVIVLPLGALLGAAGVHVAFELGRTHRIARSAAVATLLTLFALQLPTTLGRLQLRRAHTAAASLRVRATAETLRGMLKREARILGDSNLAPLLSLEIPRPLWHRMADTNTKRFRNDDVARAELFGALVADPPEVLILLDRHGLALMPQMRQFAEQTYPRPWLFELSGVDRVLVFARPEALVRGSVLNSGGATTSAPRQGLVMAN